MNKTITPSDIEMTEVINELINRANAITEAQQLGEASFRDWLCKQLQEIASALGYVIQGLAEFVKDMSYSFNKGFQQGRERARAKSLRERDKR